MSSSHEYDPRAFPRVAVTVDIVVLTIRDGDLFVVLVERGEEPYKGSWALPGGFVRPDENLAEAAQRELREETAVDAADHLEQIASYGGPGRDPRMRVVTVAHLAVLRDLRAPVAGSDAARAQLVPVKEVLGDSPVYRLAFDHREILEDGVERARSKLEYTSLATAFVGPEFTLSELREVYEAAWGEQIDPANFRRKILSAGGVVEPTGRRARPGREGGKPPETYRSGVVDRLDPPFRRRADEQRVATPSESDSEGPGAGSSTLASSIPPRDRERPQDDPWDADAVRYLLSLDPPIR